MFITSFTEEKVGGTMFPLVISILHWLDRQQNTSDILLRAQK